MKNSADKKTENKLERLERTLGNFNFNFFKDKKEVESSSYNTSETIALLILSCIIGLLVGGFITYKITYTEGKKIDKELQEFIRNYDYITKNYYGDLDKTKLIDGAIAGMLTTLDQNSNYLGSSDGNFNTYLDGNYKGMGLQVYSEDGNIIVYKVLENSPAAKAGLKEGDIILSINGKSAEDMDLQKFAAMVKGKSGNFEVRYKRDNKEETVNIETENISLASVSSKEYDKDGKKIGYIRMTIFAGNTLEQFKQNLEDLESKNIDGLVIDLRGNSGGHLTTVESILYLFLDSSHPIYQIKSKNEQTKYYSKGKEDKKYKIVILVDGDSASASEVMSSALKEQLGAKLVGEKTFGKGSVQELQTLPNGQQYKITTKMWLTSNGNQIDGVGIEPDIKASLDENYIKNPKEENDNQLQAALTEIVK